MLFFNNPYPFLWFYHYHFILYDYRYYIMTFFFLSFYFSFNTLSRRDPLKIKERFKRMIVPYIGWPFLFFMKDKIDHYIYNKKEMYNLKKLYYQILIGCGIYGVFWFIFNLIFLSLFFAVIIFIFKNKFIQVLFILCIIDYFFIHSNYAKIHFFNKFKKVPVGHSIQPIFYYFNFAFSGYYFGSVNILNKLYKNRILFFIISSVIIFAFFKNYFTYFKKIHFFFKPLIQNTFILNIFIFSALIPFDKIRNKNLMVILNKLTSYTGGVYYLHVAIANLS